MVDDDEDNVHNAVHKPDNTSTSILVSPSSLEEILEAISEPKSS